MLDKNRGIIIKTCFSILGIYFGAFIALLVFRTILYFLDIEDTSFTIGSDLLFVSVVSTVSVGLFIVVHLLGGKNDTDSN